MTIPVYTAMTGAQAAEWIKRLAPKASQLINDLGRISKVPLADVAMICLLAAVGAAKGGGFKVREFLQLLEQLGIDVE